MTKYKIYLDNGTSKIVNATTKTKAEYKYYGSSSHFRTEAAINKVVPLSKVPKRHKRKTHRSSSFWDTGISPPRFF